MLTFRNILLWGQNGFEKIKLIAIRIGFCILFTSVIFKVLFKLMQQVVLREYFKSFNLSFVLNQPIVIRKLLDPSSVQHRILFQYFQTMSWTYQIPHQWKGDIRICKCLLPNTGITCAQKTSKHCFCYLHCNCKENISMCINRKQDLLRGNYNLQYFSVFI